MLRAFGVSGAVIAASSCAAPFDATRVPFAKATLGDDIYGVFCDRLGTSSFPEDLSGASFNAICHYDEKGHYGDRVDTTALPPPSGTAQQRARTLSVAKLERLAQRRSEVIRALNAIFPDVSIPDITSKDSNAQIRLHDALFDFTQTISPLYEENPIEPKGEPLMPSQTRSMGRLFDAFASSGTCAGSDKACRWDADCGADKGICQQPVRDVLSRMWARRGYRPFQVGLGAVRPALAYPDLRKLTTSTLSVLGPGGSASAELQQVLTVVQQELATAQATLSVLPPYTVDPATTQPNRPRRDLEFLQGLLLTQHDAFAESTGTQPMYIAQRDGRGFVVPSGNTPGVAGTVPAPFSDLGNDGFADVDAFGRFIDGQGKPISVDPPFAIPGETQGTVDTFGRTAGAATSYAYLDTSRTLVGGLTKHLIPLLDPTSLAAGEPNAWQQEHESAMYALAGAYTLFGDREDATYDYAQEGAAGKTVNYRRFKPETSPLPDLVHALGQVLADKDSDALLLSLLDLFENHEQVVARLMGAALRIREISLQHDALAAQGKEKKAELAYEVPIWDEMAKIVDDILKKPALLQGLLEALAGNTVVTPYGNAQHMGDALSRFVSFRDGLTYDKYGTHTDGSAGGINGPAVNVTVGGNAHDDPKTPIDRSQPQTGDNMSCLQRSLMLIHDANGGPACNKDGAKVAAKLGGLSVTWPILGAGYGPCELFQFDNLGLFYLDSLLAPNHPKRSYLKIKASDLNGLLNFLGGVGVDQNAMLEQSSDIKGLTLHPEPYALHRLVFYGSKSSVYPAMPDVDSIHAGQQVDKFVSGSIEPVSAAWCPVDSNDPNKIPTCSDKSGTIRVRDANAIFLWERFGFTNYLAPVVTAFANTACNAAVSSCDTADLSGEKLLFDLFELLNKHWPGPDHGAECDKASSSIPCSEAGLNRYEPLLAEAFVSDIVPALHEFAKVAVEASKITVQRGGSAGQVWTGAQVLEKLTTILFSTDYAASVGMVDRQGNKAAKWVDGTNQPQLTVFTLFADALHKIDTRFASACDCSQKTGADQAECQKNVNECLADADARKGQWKRARSQLVDQFLAVEGEGTAAKFKNPTVAPTLVATLKLLREQINANCPDRESGTACTWAKKDLGDKLAGVMSRPLFAAIFDMQDKIRKDDQARRQLEAFLQYALAAATDDGETLQGTLASLSDILQVLADDASLTPILQAAASSAAPDADPNGPGMGSVTIKLLKVLTDDKYDRYHVVDRVLPNVVTPMDDGTKLAPIEIIMDVIGDVNRIDAADRGPMATDDYEAVMSTMQSFMEDKTRGVEQLYTIIQRRPKP
ncbi:Hypothetical protein A7982_06349 [Minicystis rosea]|nr:Hypothetical protein A7982_06349 [Minicystis rosea]